MNPRVLTLLMKVTAEEAAQAVYTEQQTGVRHRMLMRCLDFLGKHGPMRVSPAKTAWGQSIYHPHGMVFGATDPALFLYFYARALDEMSEQVLGRVVPAVRNAHSLTEAKLGNMDIMALAVDERNLDPELVKWYEGHCTGALLPDAPFYSIAHQTSNIDPMHQKDVLAKMDSYSLCILGVQG